MMSNFLTFNFVVNKIWTHRYVPIRRVFLHGNEATSNVRKEVVALLEPEKEPESSKNYR